MESAKIYRVCVFMAFGYLQDHELTLVSWHFFLQGVGGVESRCCVQGVVFNGAKAIVPIVAREDYCLTWSKMAWAVTWAAWVPLKSWRVTDGYCIRSQLGYPAYHAWRRAVLCCPWLEPEQSLWVTCTRPALGENCDPEPWVFRSAENLCRYHICIILHVHIYIYTPYALIYPFLKRTSTSS